MLRLIVTTVLQEKTPILPPFYKIRKPWPGFGPGTFALPRQRYDLDYDAIALSVVAAVGIVNSAIAETRKSTSQSYLSLPITGGTRQSENRGDDDGPPPAVSRNDESHNIENSDWTTADNNTIPEKYMNGLSNCESTAAADGHLKLAEIMDCFHRVF
jgi:hypothetical protein